MEHEGSAKKDKLTVSASGSSLEHESVGNGSISAQVWEAPVADDDRGDVPGQGQQVVAQMEGGGAALQLGPR